MVLDLNKIAIFGNSDGKILSTPQRQLFSLCDGIIGGQGDGPLKPEPLALGIISFTNHSGMNDILMATLMGFETNKISMLQELEKTTQHEKIKIRWNGRNIKCSDLANHAIKAKAAPGWEAHLNT